VEAKSNTCAYSHKRWVL